ncbi:MAG: helix-turn-helix domain-containing protein, partial [Candidatus Kerfeldbacteria bacterium]|nr:helix-turn-helix domain-containing protein [Candidatus Kerfeldbacteria bacterium]
DTSLFEHFGLTDKEAALYLASLKLGAATVSELATEARIKRPTAYTVIQSLLLKGYLSYAGGTVRRYSPLKPERLLTLYQRNLKAFTQLLPQLTELATQHQYKPQMKFFMGADGVRSIYEESLLQPKGTEILCLGNAQAVEDSLPGFGEWYINKRVAGKIKMRALVTDNAYHKKIQARDTQELRTTRLTSFPLFTQEMEMNVYRDTVSLVSFENDQWVGIIIQSNIFASGFRQMFEVLWKLA